jgi:hypothetical protein
MFHSPKNFRAVCASCQRSYGREARKKTAKSYAALRQEMRPCCAKNNAAFQPESGINLAG